MKAQFCVGGKGDTTLGVFMDKSVLLYQATDGTLISEVDCPFVTQDITIGEIGPSSGRYFIDDGPDVTMSRVIAVASDGHVYECNC